MLYKSHRNLYWFIAFLLCPSLSFPKMDKKPCNSQDAEVRKGPWTLEEDLILINYIANHGEGVWNSLAKSAGTSFINKILVFFFFLSILTLWTNYLTLIILIGLKRTGKSCRLRWLNYLRPDVRRGNITDEEQQLIMELHAKWGNRWFFPTPKKYYKYETHSSSSPFSSFSWEQTRATLPYFSCYFD